MHNNYKRGGKSKSNMSSFEEKNSFFYDNAIDIIESKDCYNKYCFLDLLGNFTGKEKETQKETHHEKEKPRKINISSLKTPNVEKNLTLQDLINKKKIKNLAKGEFNTDKPQRRLKKLIKITDRDRERERSDNKNHFYSGHNTNLNSPTQSKTNFFSKSQQSSPHKFIMTQIKINQKPIRHEYNKTDKTYFYSSYPNITNSFTTGMNTNFQNSPSITATQSKTGSPYKINIERHYESLSKIKMINKILSNFSKNQSQMNNYHDGNRNRNEKSSFIKNNSGTKPAASTQQSFTNPLSTISHDNPNNYSQRFSTRLFENKTLDQHLKKMKHIVDQSAKKTKIELLYDLGDRDANVKEIGKIKILTVPQKFKKINEDIQIENLNPVNHKKSTSLQLERDVVKDFYKIKNLQAIKKENFFEKLSEPNRTSLTKEGEGGNKNFLLNNLESFKNFEKTHLMIKNKILQTRKKFQNTSLWVNPKHIVTIPQEDE